MADHFDAVGGIVDKYSRADRRIRTGCPLGIFRRYDSPIRRVTAPR
jgi:hypothetical protein